MNTKLDQPDKTILFKNEVAEKQKENDINEQLLKIQHAVDAFNEIGLKPLRPDELNYFLGGREVWTENRFCVEQEIPKTWPKNVDRSKYLDMLTRPDYSKAVAACSAVNLIHTDLFKLEGDKVVIDPIVKEQVITESRIYLEPNEKEKYDKLQTLKSLLYEFGLLAGDTISNSVKPINLNQTGIRFSPYGDGIDRFYFEVQKLKPYLSSLNK